MLAAEYITLRGSASSKCHVDAVNAVLRRLAILGLSELNPDGYGLFEISQRQFQEFTAVPGLLTASLHPGGNMAKRLV